MDVPSYFDRERTQNSGIWVHRQNGKNGFAVVQLLLDPGDSETDAETAKSAGVPFILLENGYTEKKTSEIHHDHLIKDFVGIEEIIDKYINH